MPDSPSNDSFADLFARLPDPGQRASETRIDTPAAPGSRRALRHAAQAEQAAQTAHAGDAAEATSSPSSDAAASAAAVHTGTRRRDSGRAHPESVRGRAVRTTASTDSATLDALFGEEPPPHADDHRHDRDARKSRAAKWVVFGMVLAFVGGLVGVGVWVWNTYEEPLRELFGWSEPRDFEPGEATGEALVTIVSGDTGATISTTLFDAGVTKTDRAFYDYLISSALNPTFQPGVYRLQLRMTSSAALTALEDPANKRENTVLVVEGATVTQAISAIAAGTGVSEEELTAAAADFQQFGVPADAPSIEGYLFPATYTFDPDVTAVQALQRMVDETFSRLARVGVTPQNSLPVLTLAGLVQKESGPSTDDMAKIARVFLNRVDQGMLLQSDATVAYGAGTTGTVWTTPEERADQTNIYNTYVHEGLPPGPISNPGEDAIAAAIAPAAGDWLYFVAVNLQTGETAFSKTYEQHLAAVEQLDQWCSQSANASYCE